jgi:hypothetical protein
MLHRKVTCDGDHVFSARHHKPWYEYAGIATAATIDNSTVGKVSAS